MKKITWIIFASFAATAVSTTTFAEDDASKVESRLDRLERLVNSNGLFDVMVRVESLQNEIQRLVGEIEVQKHALDEIKKRQRDLYLDIDRRILQIERRSGSSTASAPTDTAEKTEEPSYETSSDRKNVPVQGAKEKEGEQVAYQKAFDLLRSLRYEQATQTFRQFLTDYPNGRYAHIAQYWLAETSYHTRKYAVAVEDYQTLINQYPKSPKRADALLKIGYSQFELQLFAQATSVLGKLIQSHPGTTEAGQAENLLQKIRLQKVQ